MHARARLASQAARVFTRDTEYSRIAVVRVLLTIQHIFGALVGPAAHGRAFDVRNEL